MGVFRSRKGAPRYLLYQNLGQDSRMLYLQGVKIEEKRRYAFSSRSGRGLPLIFIRNIALHGLTVGIRSFTKTLFELSDKVFVGAKMAGERDARDSGLRVLKDVTRQYKP